MSSLTNRYVLAAAAAALSLYGCAVAPTASKPPVPAQRIEAPTEKPAPPANSPAVDDSVDKILRELQVK